MFLVKMCLETAVILNASSPIPLYRQLASKLLADIDAGVYATETKIPSEHALAAVFDVGRPTVRQATDMLVRQGRLERRRGSGTYVKPATASIDLFSLAGTSAALRNTDGETQLELMGGVKRQSQFPNGTGSIAADCYRLQRRALVDHGPIMLETLWFKADLFNDLDQHELANRSISVLVRDVYFLEPKAADQTFSVTLANAEQAELLDVDEQAPLLQVQRSIHFANQRDALCAHIVCRTDRFDFSQTLYPAGNS